MNIVITGGCGSVGKAFVDLLHRDHSLVVIDNNEWAMAEMKSSYPQVKFLLQDFSKYSFGSQKIDGIKFKEDLVIHLAAYKHVSLGETNVVSFIDNNIVKTDRIFKRASMAGARILFVSTDKSVESVSTYGATKFLGEKLAEAYGGVVARMGNIISSSGSVIPVWEKQIEQAEPITVTDLSMTRYMIEADDAAKQIWEKYLSGEKLIIPDMGDPITLKELLVRVLARHGFLGLDSYPEGIKIIGIQPGEKIREKLRWPEEN